MLATMINVIFPLSRGDILKGREGRCLAACEFTGVDDEYVWPKGGLVYSSLWDMLKLHLGYEKSVMGFGRQRTVSKCSLKCFAHRYEARM